ncbi:MAG TPA: DUF4013 domain-containing protein [Roseiflexaceae bacterium]|nr:DUF4013 domain-containing protein [Roseiflexaceae bacterium]
MMDLRTALRNIHADPRWWRKIMIGGALMFTIIGYPFAAGMVVENMDNARKGYPTPLPPWGDWSSRYLIGLFAGLVDFLFFVLPMLLAAFLFFCVGIGSLVAGAEEVTQRVTPLIVGTVVVFLAVMFLVGVSPVARLIFVEEGSPERAMSAASLHEALRPGARRVYLRARLASLPAYLPTLALGGTTLLVAQAPFAYALPAVIVLCWLMLCALLYAHLAVGQIYAAAAKLLEAQGLSRLESQTGL